MIIRRITHTPARRQHRVPRLAVAAFWAAMGLGGYFLYALTGNWVPVFIAWALVVVFTSHE